MPKRTPHGQAYPGNLMEGMTRRELIATELMAGLMANPNRVKGTEGYTYTDIGSIAKTAVFATDALLRELGYDTSE